MCILAIVFSRQEYRHILLDISYKANTKMKSGFFFVLALFGVFYISNAVLYRRQFMTPKWIEENAEFPDKSVIQSNDGKRLVIKNPSPYYPLLFRVPIKAVGRDTNKLTVSIKLSLLTPTVNDSDVGIGICDEDGECNIVVVVDPKTYPFGRVFYYKHDGKWAGADVDGSSMLTGPFDEEVEFVLYPKDKYGAYIGSGKVINGIFPHVPDIHKKLYLVVYGDDSVEEVYAIQYIRLAMGSSK